MRKVIERTDAGSEIVAIEVGCEAHLCCVVVWGGAQLQRHGSTFKVVRDGVTREIHIDQVRGLAEDMLREVRAAEHWKERGE